MGGRVAARSDDVGRLAGGCANRARGTTMTDVNLGRASETSNDIRDIPLIFVKAHSAAANESNQHHWTGRAGSGRHAAPREGIVSC
ncbi:MAG: hypothetical protein QOF63_3988 [Thermoanaerobaculia bacterium]|jgi:hypothetical protein|nr:hypothetical protein [Thermoanaerobaculia bacterium]